MGNRYIFDLDNTLVMTNTLNNNAYNFALAALHLPTITTRARITRTTIFNTYRHLTEHQKNEIVKLKQTYFINNVHDTNPNIDLIAFLMSKNAKHCVLWTSADEKRVDSLLFHYELSNRFAAKIYSDKGKVHNDIKKICNTLGCTPNQLLFFEDDDSVANELRLLGQKVFTSMCKIDLHVLV